MNITIRKGEERDFAAIFSLIKEFAIFQRTPEKVMITLEQMIAEKDFFQCFVADTQTNAIVGFASFFLPNSVVRVNTHQLRFGKSSFMFRMYKSATQLKLHNNSSAPAQRK